MGLRASLVWAAVASLCPVRADQLDEQALIGLARAAVEAEVLHHSAPHASSKSATSPVFVTIELAGAVVGCRGDLTPRATSLEDEVILAARSAASHDPRYRPLKPGDLKTFKVTVTVVDRTEAISTVANLTPADGLVLRAGTRTGVVLPWEGKDPNVRLKWAYTKAGVPQGSPAVLLRLIATRFRG